MFKTMTFIGRNGSLGFKKYRKYKTVRLKKNGLIYIVAISPQFAYCGYSTDDKVKENWRLG